MVAGTVLCIIGRMSRLGFEWKETTDEFLLVLFSLVGVSLKEFVNDSYIIILKEKTWGHRHRRKNKLQFRVSCHF